MELPSCDCATPSKVFKQLSPTSESDRVAYSDLQRPSVRLGVFPSPARSADDMNPLFLFFFLCILTVKLPA